MLKRLQFKLQYVSYIIAFSRNFFYFLYLRGVLHQPFINRIFSFLTLKLMGLSSETDELLTHMTRRRLKEE